MLKLNRPPGPSTKEVLLPSEGYPYGHADLKGGHLLIKAFDYETESVMYGTADSNTSKQFARLCTLLSRTAEWPPGFKTAELLEGDSAFIIMAARSLSYPEQKYDFDTLCEHCGEKEHFSLRIPDELPQNRYPADFVGYISLETFNKNFLKMRFLTLTDDAECNRISRDRLSKKIIMEDMFEADYNLNRLCFHLVEANDSKPENIEDSRQFFRTMPSDEREEIIRAMRRHAPGISSILTINCPKCNGQYEAFVPMGPDFFRAGARAVRAKLPGGVRIGSFGPDDFRDQPDRAAAKDNDRVLNPTEKGRTRSGSKSNEGKKVMPPPAEEPTGKALTQFDLPYQKEPPRKMPFDPEGELVGPYDKAPKKVHAPPPPPAAAAAAAAHPSSIQTS